MVSDPPAPGPEITIDLDGDPQPAPAPARARIPNAALALAALVLVVAAGAVTALKWLPIQEPTAAATVRSFLEAVRAGDVDTALALTEERSGAADFLVPEALDSRWKINKVAQVEYEEVPGRWARAEVYVEIEAYDGTRLANRYAVTFESGRARVINGLSSSEFYGDLSLRAMEVNGFEAQPDVTEQFLLLLPGVYHFYESSPETLEQGMPPVLALGDKFAVLGQKLSSPWLGTPWPEFTEEGLRLLHAVLRDHYDGCAENPSRDGCPFAPPEGEDRVAIPDDAVWEITAYPQVAASYAYLTGDTDQEFELVTTRPGMVEVDAVVTEADGGERRTRLSCGIWVEGIFAMAHVDGTVEIEPRTEAERACRTMAEVD